MPGKCLWRVALPLPLPLPLPLGAGSGFRAEILDASLRSSSESSMKSSRWKKRTLTAPNYVQTPDGSLKLRVIYQNDIVIPTDWTSQQLALRKAQHELDLAKAGRIIMAQLDNRARTQEGEDVTAESLALAKAVALRDEKIAKGMEVKKKEEARESFEKGYSIDKRTGKLSCLDQRWSTMTND